MHPSVQAIFRTYDIRGIVGKTLDESLMHDIGRALAEELHDTRTAQGKAPEIAVGYDGRLSGPSLSQALIAGLIRGGALVRSIGMVPTPTTYLAAHFHAGGSGAMITGSHNPSEYNGCKMMIDGVTLAAERIVAIRDRIMAQAFTERPGGCSTPLDYLPEYQRAIVADVPLAKPLKIVVDCGNGVTGVLAKSLFDALGCDTTVLYEAVDGNFPNHHPDPSQAKNLLDIQREMQNNAYQVGLAFDGDGDRVGVITPSGKVFAGDQLLMLFAEQVLRNHPSATILYDVKCTSLLAPWVTKHGGVPVMTKTGHALIKREIKKTGAKLAGEMSGHIFFNDRWPGFDDAIYAAARLLQLVAAGLDLEAWLAQFPALADTPELTIACEEGEPHRLVAQLQAQGVFDGATVNTIDGVRAEFFDHQGRIRGFGLVRPSNTTPILVLRFEAVDIKTLDEIQSVFARELRHCKPTIVFPSRLSGDEAADHNPTTIPPIQDVANRAPLVFLPTPTIIRLIMAGFAANVGLSLLLGFIIAFAFALPLVMDGKTSDEINSALNDINPSSWVFIAITVAGFIGSALGGFVTARLAKQQEILYASLLALFNVSLSLLVMLWGSMNANEASEASPGLPWLIVVLIMAVDFYSCIQGGKIAKYFRTR